MKQNVANYAVARFRPYADVGEFVNVGVALICPEAKFSGYLLSASDFPRIRAFFPEFDIRIFKSGLHSLGERLEAALSSRGLGATVGFQELVRPREGLFFFSEPSTVLCEDPAAKLKELFEHYVQRPSAVASPTAPVIETEISVG